jgi:hypothetical protein
MTQLAVPLAPQAPPAPLATRLYAWALAHLPAYADVPVYHYPDGDPLGSGEAVCDGIAHCRVAIHENPIDHLPVCTCVRPGAPLPQGWRWATLADVTFNG